MRRKASRNNKNAKHAIENTCKQKQNRHTLMVGWEKPVTRYNKNNNNRTITKICIVTRIRMLEIKNAGDQEWLNARGKKSLRSARWHLCSLSLASLLLDPTVACTLHFQCYTVQRSLPISVLYNLYITIFTIISASCTTIFTKRFRSTYIYIYIHIYIYIYIH